MKRLVLSLLATSLAAPFAAPQDLDVQVLWSDKWNAHYHRLEDLDGNGDMLGPGEVALHVDPAAASATPVGPLHQIQEAAGNVSLWFDITTDTIHRGLDADGSGMIDPDEISVYRDSGALDGSSGGQSLAITDDRAVWFTSRGLISQPVNGLVRLKDLDGDGDADQPAEGAVMVDANGTHIVEHDLGTSVISPWSMNALVAAGDGVIAYESNDHAIYRFEDLDGDGNVTGPFESILLLNASGERPDLPMNPDFADGTLKSLQSKAGYPAMLTYMATHEEGGERVFFFGTSVSPYNDSGLNMADEGINFLIFRGVDNNADGDVNDAGEVTMFLDASSTDGNPDLLIMRGMDVTADGQVYAAGLQPFPALFAGPEGNLWLHRFVDLDGDDAAMSAGEQDLNLFDLQVWGPGPMFPDPPLYGTVMADLNSFSVFESSPWDDLGGGTVGIAGQPTLLGEGTLEAGTLTSLLLTQAPSNALVMLWISFSSTPVNIWGGTIHALPFASQTLLNASSSGELPLFTGWPAGIPSGFQAYFQYAVQDTSVVPKGITLSNAIRSTQP